MYTVSNNNACNIIVFVWALDYSHYPVHIIYTSTQGNVPLSCWEMSVIGYVKNHTVCPYGELFVRGNVHMGKFLTLKSISHQKCAIEYKLNLPKPEPT